MANKVVEDFPGKRITITTPLPYSTVLSRLDAEINAGPLSPRELLNFKPPATATLSSVTSRYQAQAGPAGFMQFHEFNHGGWIRLFNVGGGLRMKRILLGNPLIAITMLRHDLNAGMYVPVEILVRELEEGTMLVWFLPSSLIAGCSDNEELGKAARALDAMLERLLEGVTAA
jgi:uncharacterized protein (DUF302 family)